MTIQTLTNLCPATGRYPITRALVVAELRGVKSSKGGAFSKMGGSPALFISTSYPPFFYSSIRQNAITRQRPNYRRGIK